MEAIYCTDKNFGYLFGSKRVSMDSRIIEDIVNNLNEKPLWIKQSSVSLFEKFLPNNSINIVENFNFTQDGFFFLEEAIDYQPDNIIIYNFNRNYPCTSFLNYDLNNNFKKIEEFHFEGTSHKKITKLIFRRNCYEK